MSNHHRHPVRRAAAGVLAGTLALTGGALATGLAPASADTGFTLTRVAGDTRYDTSAAIAAKFGPSTKAILASGETGRYADALSASFLAGVQGAPVLLTQRDATPAVILAALQDAGVTNITLVGGSTVISLTQELSLRAAGFTVTRLGGVDRYATSRLVIGAGAAAASPVGLIATGQGFADALGGGPLAYAGKHPMGLVTADAVPADTLAALQDAGVSSVIILGGTTVVGTAVEAQLAAAGITVATRLAGVDRSATSSAIADYVLANSAFTDTTINVASGADALGGVDALGGAALSGKEARALLITNTPDEAGEVDVFAAANSATLNAEGYIFGGLLAVSAAVETAVVTAGATPAPVTTNQSFTVTPAEAATQALQSEVGLTPTADDRTFTATGLAAGTSYRVTLVNNESISSTDGIVSFLSSADAASSTGFSADTGTDIADITSVNSVTISGVNTTTTQAVNGSITVTVDGAAVGTVTPVLYIDGAVGGTATTGGTSTRLETAATVAATFAQPVESFGIGGATTYTNPVAATQTVVAPTAVTTVNKAANQFDAAGQTFTYDANDTFTVGGLPASLDEFEVALSGGDTFGSSYSATAGAVSTFALTDANPGAPSSVTAAKGNPSSNDIAATVAFTAGTNLDSIVVQRATVVGGTNNVADGTVGTYATLATVTPSAAQIAAGSLIYSDDNVAVGTYRYRAALVNDANQGAVTADTLNETSTAPAADATAPLAIDTISTASTGLSGDLGTAGDIFKVVYDEDIAAPAGTATFRLTDSDTTVADLVNGSNATFTVNAAAETVNGISRAANRVLTVTLTGAPTTVVAGSPLGVQLPATITAAGGITDTIGNVWTPVGGAQDVIVNALAADTQNNSLDTVLATVVATDPAIGATTVVFTANEALTAGSVVVADFSGTGTVTAVVLSSDGLTITATVTALTVGQTVILNAGSTTDLAGNASPVATVTATA